MSTTGAGGPRGTGWDDVERCVRCGARVVATQDWCSLCLQPVGAPTDPGTDPGTHPGTDPGAAVGADPSGPVDPADPNASAAPPPARPGNHLPPGAAEAMLAELAASSAAERPLSRGPLAGRGRGVRRFLGCGAGLVLVAAAILLVTLVDLLV